MEFVAGLCWSLVTCRLVCRMALVTLCYATSIVSARKASGLQLHAFARFEVAC